MPASWQELFGSFRGRVRFRRTFHRPTNVDRHERVLLVFDEVAGSGSVSLNGRCLGALGDSAPTNEFDVTAHLSESNTLDVEFEFVSPPTDSRPGGLHGTVALVIRKQVGIHASACPAAR